MSYLAPKPRPLRDGDTLGRAGRAKEGGKPIQVERNRDPTSQDLRRVALLDAPDPALTVTTPGPLCDANGPLPVVDGSDSRGLQHLDGRSEPRPPRWWEDQRSDQRSGEFGDERTRMTREARQAFESLPLFKRLEHVMQDATGLQTPKAQVRRETDAKSAVEGDRSPQGEGAGAVGYLDPHEIDGRLQQIALHIGAIFDAIEAHKGHGVKDISLMTSEQKDALLIGPKLRGLSGEEIHAIYGDAIGKPRTIRLVRSEAGQDGRGNPKTKREAA